MGKEKKNNVLNFLTFPVVVGDLDFLTKELNNKSTKTNTGTISHQEIKNEFF